MSKRFDDDDVKVIARETVFKGYFQVDRWHLSHRRFDGSWSDDMTRECFERGHAVGVLPYDPKTDRVVLIEQYRVGAHAAHGAPVWDTPPYPWLVEIVAGIVEEGETVADVGARELQEEAGLTAEAWLPMMTYHATPGGSSESVALLAAQVDSTKASGIHGLASENEDIRVWTETANTCFEMVRDGRVTNSMTIIALQWLELNRDRLLRHWTQAAQASP